MAARQVFQPFAERGDGHVAECFGKVLESRAVQQLCHPQVAGQEMELGEKGYQSRAVGLSVHDAAAHAHEGMFRFQGAEDDFE